MSDYLPLDLVTDILLRLPVAAILRCRSVCKSWRALIDSPRFTKLQIDYSAATTQNAVLFILEDDGAENRDLHFAPYIDGLRQETCLDLRSNPSSSAQIRVTIPRESITLFGSCNGLLCFEYEAKKAIIVNPATRKSHVTPAIPNLVMVLDMSKEWIYRHGCGFGYDSVSDDYKVVKVNQVYERNENAEVFRSQLVSYGVRSNSSVAVKFPYFLDVTEKTGVFVGGAIHWLVIKPGIFDVIVGFDLGISECKEIPQPEYPNGKPFSIGIGELGKCLCIFAKHWEKFVDVWMMKEYGVKESWSVLFSIPHPRLCCSKIRSLGFSMTGQEILLELDAKRLIWYDLKRNPQGAAAAKEITPRGLKKKGFIDAIVCFGSLVSPLGKLPPKEEVKVDKQRKKKKRDDFLSAGFKLKL